MDVKTETAEGFRWLETRMPRILAWNRLRSVVHVYRNLVNVVQSEQVSASFSYVGRGKLRMAERLGCNMRSTHAED